MMTEIELEAVARQAVRSIPKIQSMAEEDRLVNAYIMGYRLSLTICQEEQFQKAQQHVTADIPANSGKAYCDNDEYDYGHDR